MGENGSRKPIAERGRGQTGFIVDGILQGAQTIKGRQQEGNGRPGQFCMLETMHFTLLCWSV